MLFLLIDITLTNPVLTSEIMLRIAILLSLIIVAVIVYSQEPTIIGETFYDMQTHGSCQNRIYHYEDGCIGASWTYGMDYVSYPDRGTGYNFYDGSTWQSWPEERIETQRTGWPSYAPYGENGELVVAHLSGADSMGLMFSKRETKGEGDWIEKIFTGPDGHEEIFWPRMVTGGEDHSTVFLLTVTAPTSTGGSIYQGLNGALLYSRSLDGGETWDIHNQILPGLDSTEFHGFWADCYSFVEPKNNIIAFVVGSPMTDLFLMKSTDFGQTFEKTIIWENTIESLLQNDTLYSVDGSIAASLDNNGKAHVVFGIIGLYLVNSIEINFDRSVDGVGYWNEDMESFSTNSNALNPLGGPGSEMIQNYNLIGWSQDINGNGQLDFIGFENYGIFGISSMVQIVIDDGNWIFVGFTSITEMYDAGYANYRRLWFRSSLDGGNNWGQFYHHGVDNPYYIFADFMFPSFAPISDENIDCLFLTGPEPGLYVYGGNETPDWNTVWHAQIPKDEIVGIPKHLSSESFTASRIYPNPSTDNINLNVTLQKPENLSIEITSLSGELVYELKQIKGWSGTNTFTLSPDHFPPGIYLINISDGKTRLCRKLVKN